MGALIDAEVSTQSLVAVVAFPQDAPAPVPIDGTALLEFPAERKRATLTMRGRVLERIVDDLGSRVRFELDADDRQAMFSVVNRRCAVRVAPRLTPPVLVSLLGLDGTNLGDALMRDVSVAGVSLALDPALETATYQHDRMELSFRLDERTGTSRFIGRVQYRRLTSRRIQVGIAFDSEETQDFAQQERVLRNWVVQRQVELMRAQAEGA